MITRGSQSTSANLVAERRGYPEPVVDHTWAVRRFKERRSGQLTLADA